jgi:peptide/nickel transport system ATP-binding protein
MNNATTPLLSVLNLRVWFELRRFGFGHAGYVHAVDGISFDLERGAAIAVVGESGCGKSSLMKTILGLNPAREGKVIFDDTDIYQLDKKDLRKYRARIGFVQQDPFGALPPFMTVQEILEEPLIIAGVRSKPERVQRVRKAMEEVKMSPVADFLPKYPHMLSGGQQQRIVIARAMIREPKFLVADEPVSMLDASVRVEILTLLRNLQETHHLSVIYITHDLSTVSYFSERIFVMYAGQIVEKAPVQEMLRGPKHPYTQALLTATSDPDADNALDFKKIPAGEPPSLVQPPAGCRFHPRCPQIMNGLCDVKGPPEFILGPGHEVSCWFYQ